MSQILPEMLYNLLNSQAFWIIMGIWLFICIAWASRWRVVLVRLATLVPKPVIFTPDPEPNNIPFYPRKFMEDSANAFRNYLRKPFSDSLKMFSGWVKGQHRLVYSSEHPFRTLGYIIFLAAFLFFAYADAIAVANTLSVLGLFSGQVPPLLTRFDLAVFGGSLLALIIGMALVFEIQSAVSQFSQWSDKGKNVRGLARGISLLVTLLSFLTLIVWALARLIELDKIEATPFLEGVVNWVLYGLVPVNSALSAAICFSEAMIGILVIAVVVEWIIIGLLYLVDFLATVLGSVVPFLFDVSYRIVYIVLDILQWFVTTPIQALLLPFQLIVTMMSGEKEEKPTKNKETPNSGNGL
jgi:hypothetical protein